MSGEQRPGDWRCVCDISGFDCWASETVLRWDGLRVLARFSEPRHPQDFVKAVKDNPTVPWTRPVAPMVSISPYLEDSDGNTILDSSGYAVWGL